MERAVAAGDAVTRLLEQSAECTHAGPADPDQVNVHGVANVGLSLPEGAIDTTVLGTILARVGERSRKQPFIDRIKDRIRDVVEGLVEALDGWLAPQPHPVRIPTRRW
jgi:hypothetical protein